MQQIPKCKKNPKTKANILHITTIFKYYLEDRDTEYMNLI